MVLGFTASIAVGCSSGTDVANNNLDGSDPGGPTEMADMGSPDAASPPPVFGHVSFITHYQKGAGLMWDGHPDRLAGLKAVYDEFSANLRTSGNWDAVIDVCLDETAPPGANVYGRAITPSFQTTFRGFPVRAVPAWQKITQNVDPNGAVGSDVMTGCDFRMQWNFALGEPSTNPGLARHETLHGLGASSIAAGQYMLDNPSVTWTSGGAPITPTTRLIPSVHDLMLVDKNATSLFLDPNASGYLFLTNPVFDPSASAIVNHSTGMRARGIGDDKGDYFMTIEANGSLTTRICSLDLSHLWELMYATSSTPGAPMNHPNFNHIAAPDRAWFRAMGYKVQADLN